MEVQGLPVTMQFLGKKHFTPLPEPLKNFFAVFVWKFAVVFRNPGKHFPYNSVGLSALSRQFSKEADPPIDSPSCRPIFVDPLTSFLPSLPFPMIPSKRKMEGRRTRLGNVDMLISVEERMTVDKRTKKILIIQNQKDASLIGSSVAHRDSLEAKMCVSVLQSALSRSTFPPAD